MDRRAFIALFLFAPSLAAGKKQKPKQAPPPPKPLPPAPKPMPPWRPGSVREADGAHGPVDKSNRYKRPRAAR